MKRAEIVYHGTRKSAEVIGREGLKPLGQWGYIILIRRVLSELGIPYRYAIRNKRILNEIQLLKAKGGVPADSVWVTTDRENGCYYARSSPEKLSLILEELGVDFKPYLEKRFGPPKVVTIKLPPDLPDHQAVWEGEVNVPFSHIPPEWVVSIDACH